MQEKEIKYLSHRRYKGKTMTGEEVNLPAMQEVVLKNNILYWNNRPIAFDTSEVAHQYFAVNWDGQGKRRGDLTQFIQKYLYNNQEKWERVWKDSLCSKYKRVEHQDFWLWNHLFFSAPINDLEYIVKLIEEK